MGEERRWQGAEVRGSEECSSTFRWRQNCGGARAGGHEREEETQPQQVAHRGPEEAASRHARGGPPQHGRQEEQADRAGEGEDEVRGGQLHSAADEEGGRKEETIADVDSGDYWR